MRYLTILLLTSACVACGSKAVRDTYDGRTPSSYDGYESPDGAFSMKSNRKIKVWTMDGEKFAKYFRGPELGNEYVGDVCSKNNIQYVSRVMGISVVVGAKFDQNGKPVEAVLSYTPDQAPSAFVSLEQGDYSSFAPPTRQLHAVFTYSPTFWGRIESISFDEDKKKRLTQNDLDHGASPAVEMFRSAARYVPTLALYCVRKGS